jgi:hypothetical protein
MAHNTKTLAWSARRIGGGPAEVLAPSNRVSAGMVQMAEERDALTRDLAEMRRLGEQRARYRAWFEAGEMSKAQHDECERALTAYLWAIAEGR